MRMLAYLPQPKPKPRLAPSGSMPDMLSSGSSAPFGLLSQDAVRHDVASLTLDSSPAEVPEIVMARPTPPPSCLRLKPAVHVRKPD